jgi:cellulose synthase/poly-beta-1,6-N-acetylglucosamine synthase-like glycosyltransferase
VCQPDEILVVVDGVAPEAVVLAEQHGALVLRTGTRRGPAAARNLGARAAGGDVLLFIDADVVVTPTTIGDVIRIFREDLGIHAIIGSYDRDPQAPNFLSQYKNLLHHYVHQNAREDGHTFWGACGAVRRRVFLDVGGFDERYRVPCIEDVELGYRLKQSGCRIAVVKSLQVKHLKRWTPSTLLGTDFFRRALPWTELILRSGRLEDDLNTDWAARVKVTLAWAVVSLTCASYWWPGTLALAMLAAAALLALENRLLTFFRTQRGRIFAIRTIPWLWFYYLYSGLAFSIGLSSHLWRLGRGFVPRKLILPGRLAADDVSSPSEVPA